MVRGKRGYTAHGRFLRISPSKVRPLADLVRRQPYAEALALLETMPHKGAALLRKTIKSAGDNALFHNEDLDEETLYVRELQVLDGPRLKRIWVRGRGRADRQMSRLCHISVAVEEMS
ncbi:MAG: 50S ribosomal protein L22 [Spirochaetaceae bacterium]|nr:50S ribosomal protein L22 [Spirochaetaceae bacterium]